MRGALFALGLLLSASTAGASATSAVTLGDDVFFMMGAELLLGQGTRPAFLPVEQSFRRLALGWRARGGWVDEATELGTQTGFELEMYLGWTPKESDPVGPEDEVGFSLRLGMPLRIATTAVPVLSAVTLHVSAELGAGHARWWTNTARLSLMGGVRSTTRLTDDIGLELDYVAVPFVVTGSPHYIKYNRFEHRLLLTGGYGSIGGGVQLTLSHDIARTTHRGPGYPTADQALSLILYYRYGP